MKYDKSLLSFLQLFRIFDNYGRTVHENDAFTGFLKFHRSFSCFPKFHHVIWFNGTAIVFTFSDPTFCSSVRFSCTFFHTFIFRFSTVRRLKTSFLMNNPLLWTLFYGRQLKQKKKTKKTSCWKVSMASTRLLIKKKLNYFRARPPKLV